MDSPVVSFSSTSLYTFLYLEYLHLKDSARFGDVTRLMYDFLQMADNHHLLNNLWVTVEELVEIEINGLKRAKMKCLHRGDHLAADGLAIQKMEFERQLEINKTYREITPFVLKQILRSFIRI